MKTDIGMFLMIVLALTACREQAPVIESTTSKDGGYIPVANVPLTQKVDSFNLKLEAYLARNFMPSVPLTGAPLNCLIQLTESSGKAIQDKFELLSFKLAAEKIYQPTFTNDTVSFLKSQVSRISHDGPMLEPGGYVDVVCEYKYLSTGEIYQILASRRKIERSE